MKPGPRDAAAFALAAIAFWTGLGSYGLVETSDARYAEIAREMVVSGDWLLPRLLGILHFDKPPLIYWLSGAGYATLGLDEWGGRACLAVLGLTLCAWMWAFTRRHLGPKTAPWTVAVLAGMPAVIAASRMLTTDLLLCVCLTVSLTGFYDRWSGRGGRGAWLAMYAGAGLAFLAKGPVGWLVLLLIIIPFALRHRAGHERPAPAWGRRWGIPLALLIALPWYLIAVSEVPGLLSYFLGQQLASRLHAGGLGHPHPWYYFVFVFPALGLPWLLLLPAGLRKLRADNPSLADFALWWLILPPLFFSLPSTKLALYVLPAFPALALLVAHALARGDVRKPVRIAAFFLPAVGLTVVGLGVLAPQLPGSDLVDIPRSRLLAIVVPIGVAAVVAGALAFHFTRPSVDRPRLAGVCIALAMALVPAWALLNGDSLPARSVRVVGLAAAEHRRPGDLLVEYRDLAAGLPLYTQSLPLLVDIDQDTRFEDADSLARVIERDAFLRDVWPGPDRVLVVTHPEHVVDLPGAQTLAHGGGYVLVVNR